MMFDLCKRARDRCLPLKYTSSGREGRLLVERYGVRISAPDEDRFFSHLFIVKFVLLERTKNKWKRSRGWTFKTFEYALLWFADFINTCIINPKTFKRQTNNEKQAQIIVFSPMHRFQCCFFELIFKPHSCSNRGSQMLQEIWQFYLHLLS